jgi:hypothetical protein
VVLGLARSFSLESKDYVVDVCRLESLSPPFAGSRNLVGFKRTGNSEGGEIGRWKGTEGCGEL